MARSNLSGLEEVLERIDKLRTSTVNKEVRKALRKSMVPIRDQAKQNAKNIDDKKTKEKIWRNIKIVSKKKKSNGDITCSVGVGGGAKKGGTAKKGPGLDTWYWRFIETGTSKAPATPFLRTAFEQKKSDATDIFVLEMRKSILEEIR
ncbi:HK97 gp10 family phage protein [Acinetobacter bereziniae]|uniref:HK97-gp10 family putative phage morphogenesis protein n=1 Tax=Acinetobacter bereziniae TaxID=106648 RepID=UPI0021CD57BF|nr:HK97-gp10 family putative phage morphogenesis protein [Acinetobacter bereziniae]MCU4539636.1 HK97 gp10 family phage protein [Acinetobacter bereziniae]MCU4624185.1 HK97 gp10 family phage protein [Acinetobacter bereziniae]